ncbi:MAG: hypothetical protein ABSF90_27995, partial [Syntrophobacteraceae bacterium]
ELTKRAGDFPPRPRDFCHTRKRVRQSAAPRGAWRSAQRSSPGATAAPLLNGPAMAKLGATRTFFVVHWHHLERKLVSEGHLNDERKQRLGLIYRIAEAKWAENLHRFHAGEVKY